MWLCQTSQWVSEEVVTLRWCRFYLTHHLNKLHSWIVNHINRVCVGVRRWFRWWLVWSARCSRATARAPSTAEASVCRSPFLTSKTTSSRISNSSTASYRRIRVKTTGLCRPEPGFTWRRPCRRSDAQTTHQRQIRWVFIGLKTFADADVRDGPRLPDGDCVCECRRIKVSESSVRDG